MKMADQEKQHLEAEQRKKRLERGEGVPFVPQFFLRRTEGGQGKTNDEDEKKKVSNMTTTTNGGGENDTVSSRKKETEEKGWEEFGEGPDEWEWVGHEKTQPLMNKRIIRKFNMNVGVSVEGSRSNESETEDSEDTESTGTEGESSVVTRLSEFREHVGTPSSTTRSSVILGYVAVLRIQREFRLDLMFTIGEQIFPEIWILDFVFEGNAEDC